MLERVLIPLDMTVNAERVLPYASMLAKGLQMPAVVISVVMQAPIKRSSANASVDVAAQEHVEVK